MLTYDIKRDGKGRITHVDRKKVPKHLENLRIPPAWTQVQVDPDPKAVVIAMGVDNAERLQRLYSPTHIANAKDAKFQRVAELLSEWEDIRSEIESALNNKSVTGKDREAALVAYLIYETGMRPGSTSSAYGDNSQEGTATFGATTLQLRHVKPCTRGVRLKFVGKKGVAQNILVTNPYLVDEMLERKEATTSWSAWLFDVSSSKVNQFIRSLGSTGYTAKDFRTARGTSLALELLGNRKRYPRTKTKRRKVVNAALDKVAKTLGNTRAIARSAYVEPSIVEQFLNAGEDE